MADRGARLILKWIVTVSVTVLVTVTAGHTTGSVQQIHTVDELSPVELGTNHIKALRIRGPQLDITLDLERNTNLPVSTVEIDDHLQNHSIRSINHETGPIGPYYYQNLEHQTALEIKRSDTGQLMLQGSIGGYAIEPAKTLQNMNRSISTEQQSFHHKVTRRSMDYHNFLKNYRVDQPNECDIAEVYPEILLMLDHGLHQSHHQDRDKTISFASSFLNEMDVILKAIPCPKIRIHVSNIGQARQTELPYIKRNEIQPESGHKKIDVKNTLYDFARWVYKVNSKLPTFDVVLQLTSQKLCMRQGSLEPQCGIYGFAFPGGLCKINSRYGQINSVAIVYEPGGYSGVLTAIHELLHLMSATHDDNDYEEKTSGCPSSDGYIMSKGYKNDLNQFKPSTCTINQIRDFYKKDGLKCLLNKPPQQFQLLPEHRYVLTADEQCRRLAGNSSCRMTCTELYCRWAATGSCIAYEPPMEGTACDDGQGTCHIGTCVHHQ